jgi:hypothetical protein
VVFRVVDHPSRVAHLRSRRVLVPQGPGVRLPGPLADAITSIRTCELLCCGVNLVLRVLAVLAAVDWALAFGLTAAGVHRHVSVPLLFGAASVLLGCHRSQLAHLAAEVRGAPARGISRWTAAEAALAEQWSPRAAALILREPRLLWSVVLLLRGRRDGAAGATYSAYRQALPIWSLLGGLALLEVALTPLLPLPKVVEAVLVLVGGWGLVVVVGMTAALVVHPHVVAHRDIRVRFGFWDEVLVPRAIVVRARATPERTAARGVTVNDGRGSVSPAGLTNVQLDLDPPVTVRGQLVVELRLWADAPEAFASACRSEGAGA